jgi:hypothetical protein
MNEAQSATLSADQRKKVLDRVLAALQKRFYEPEKLNSDWQAAVQRHRPLIESADTSAEFEREVSDLLKELQTSHLGFFHRSARRASSRAALSATYLEDETICRPIPLLAPVIRATRCSDIHFSFQTGGARAAQAFRMSCLLVDGFSGELGGGAPPSRFR